ncbi:hypothetical protein LWI28_015055 [Acer negundo]|uniref:Uncharacterized protein n=1 Tax=Acer negundo TaxID=4023 RepID=A0AAD5NWU7_ACENE|nr:hypothetical protein LWI28_015055 [Acer negundo]
MAIFSRTVPISSSDKSNESLFSVRLGMPQAGQHQPFRLAPIHVLSVAESLASLTDRGQCMGSTAANLTCEPTQDAEWVKDSSPKHWDPSDGCTMRRNSVPMDRLKGCAVRRNSVLVDPLKGSVVRRKSIPLDRPEE